MLKYFRTILNHFFMILSFIFRFYFTFAIFTRSPKPTLDHRFAGVLSTQSFYFDKFSQPNHFLKTLKNLSRHHFNANSSDFLDFYLEINSWKCGRKNLCFFRHIVLKALRETLIVISFLSIGVEMSSVLNLLTEKQQRYHPRYERKTPKKIKTSQQSQFFD